MKWGKTYFVDFKARKLLQVLDHKLAQVKKKQPKKVAAKRKSKKAVTVAQTPFDVHPGAILGFGMDDDDIA